MPGLRAVRFDPPGGQLFAFNAIRSTIKQQARLHPGRDQGGQRHDQSGPARRSLRRPDAANTLPQPRLGALRRARTAARSCARRTAGHGDAVQREPAALERLRANGLFGAAACRCSLASATRWRSASSRRSASGSSLTSGTSTSTPTNAYDFGVLFDTPIAFPVAWDHSKIDGFTGEINLVEHGGFSAFIVMAHTNAIFSSPGRPAVSSLEPNRRRLPDRPRSEVPADDEPAVRFEQAERRLGGVHAGDTTLGWWPAPSPDYATALALTGDQQAAIGLFCGSTVATRDDTDRRAATRRTAAQPDCGFPPKAPKTM